MAPGAMPVHSQLPSVVTVPSEGQPYAASKMACSWYSYPRLRQCVGPSSSVTVRVSTVNSRSFASGVMCR
jgi:hypothetical protein